MAVPVARTLTNITAESVHLSLPEISGKTFSGGTSYYCEVLYFEGFSVQEPFLGGAVYDPQKVVRMRDRTQHSSSVVRLKHQSKIPNVIKVNATSAGRK